MHKKSAFSLIELSIVILIIGILIAGVTKGSQLMSKAKIKTANTLTTSSPVSGIKDLVFWFETTLPESFGEIEHDDGGAITTWHDINPQSQHQYVLTQDTAGNRPTFVEDGQNGLPGIRFDGSNDNLPFASGVDFSQMKTQDFFCVLKSELNGTYGNVFAQYDHLIPSTSFVYRIVYNSSNAIGTGFMGLEGATTPTPTAIQIYNGYITPSEWGISNDAQTFVTKVATSSINSATEARPKIGSTSADVHQLKGTIYEMILFSRKLKNDEREAIRDYLIKKWNL